MVCSVNLYLLDSVLVGCKSLESCPFILGCPICWHIIVHSILLCFVSLQYPLRFLLFHFLFYLVVSLLFLVSLARALSIFFTLSKNRLLVLLFFSYCFLNVYFIELLSDYYDFLPSPTLVLFVLFHIHFVGGLSCQLRFFFFFKGGLYHYELLSEHCCGGIP